MATGTENSLRPMILGSADSMMSFVALRPRGLTHGLGRPVPPRLGAQTYWATAAVPKRLASDTLSMLSP